MEKVLIKFSHGLGDAAQFTIVLKHLKSYYPDWVVDVFCLIGKHSAMKGLCNRVYHDREIRPLETSYDKVFELYWWENYIGYKDRPNTKVSNCLKEVFGLDYDLALGKYQILIDSLDLDRAASYLRSIGCEREGSKFNSVVFHYQGNTAPQKKNARDIELLLLIGWCLEHNYVPVVLDWDNRTKLVDQKTVFCPRPAGYDIWGGTGTGDAATIAALIEQSSLFVGVDSGPQKCAGSTTTPSIGLWFGHSLIQFFDLCSNFVHMIPKNWRTIAPCSASTEIQAFTEHFYSLREYQNRSSLAVDLRDQAIEMLKGERPLYPEGIDPNWERTYGFYVRRDYLDQDMVILRDIYLNDAYKTDLFGPDRGPEVVVDVGAHIGCFARKWHEKNPEAFIVCVEACPENIPLLQQNVGSFAQVIHAACVYDTDPVGLLNSIHSNGESTGGSIVVSINSLTELVRVRKQVGGSQYWSDTRPLEKMTLEDILIRYGFDHIDVLKLDCEGSEFSILKNTFLLHRIRFILGEYHDRERWHALRAERFQGWDYGEMHGDPHAQSGTFHLANRVWPPLPLSKEQMLEKRYEDISDYYFAHRAVEEDRNWLSTQSYRFNAKQLMERVGKVGVSSVLEFGCGSGLLATTLPSTLNYTGVDQSVDFINMAVVRNPEKTFIKEDVRSFSVAAPVDLVFSFAFMKHFAAREWEDVYTKCLKQGNYALMEVLLSDRIVEENRGYHHVAVTKDSLEKALSRAGHQLLEIKPVEIVNVGEDQIQVCLVFSKRQTKSRMLRVAVPPGIGDALWVLVKIQSLMQQQDVEKIDLIICGGDAEEKIAKRSLDFLRHFSFVHSVEVTKHSVINPILQVRDGSWNYFPVQEHWQGEFDWLLQANDHLERGKRLEDWYPNWKANWDIMRDYRFPMEDSNFGEVMRDVLGSYVVFYMGPEEGNTVIGQNRLSRWAPKQWVQLAEALRDHHIVVVGAEWDKSYFEKYIVPLGYTFQNRIGKWSISRTLSVIKNAKAYVGYQSGLGVASIYMGIPTVSFWRPYGDSILPNVHLSFREEMSTAWVQQEDLDSGKYYPCIYTRTTPEEIAVHLKTFWREYEFGYSGCMGKS